MWRGECGSGTDVLLHIAQCPRKVWNIEIVLEEEVNLESCFVANDSMSLNFWYNEIMLLFSSFLDRMSGGKALFFRSRGRCKRF